jgi:hypothetical protein
MKVLTFESIYSCIRSCEHQWNSTCKQLDELAPLRARLGGICRRCNNWSYKNESERMAIAEELAKFELDLTAAFDGGTDPSKKRALKSAKDLTITDSLGRENIGRLHLKLSSLTDCLKVLPEKKARIEGRNHEDLAILKITLDCEAELLRKAFDAVLGSKRSPIADLLSNYRQLEEDQQQVRVAEIMLPSRAATQDLSAIGTKVPRDFAAALIDARENLHLALMQGDAAKVSLSLTGVRVLRELFELNHFLEAYDLACVKGQEFLSTPLEVEKACKRLHIDLSMLFPNTPKAFATISSRDSEGAMRTMAALAERQIMNNLTRADLNIEHIAALIECLTETKERAPLIAAIIRKISQCDKLVAEGRKWTNISDEQVVEYESNLSLL